MTRALAVAMSVLLWLVSTGAERLCELELKEISGVERRAWPVTTGVPMPQGLLRQPDEVVLLDAAGNPVPAQFAVQSRWIRDGSIRWLLVDTQADIGAGELKRFALARRPADYTPPASPLKVVDAEHAVTVVTGPLKFVVSKREGFQLFSAVWLDVDGDGKFRLSEQIIQPAADDGAALLEMGTGKWHLSAAAAPRRVVVETLGPLRAVIRVDGTHIAREGIPGGCYDYTCRIYAYAGKSFLKVQYTLKNLRWQRPFRSYRFKDGVLTTTVAVGSGRACTFGHEAGPVRLELQPGETASLYQDSSGGPRWKQDLPNQYSTWPDGRIPGVTFRGYRIRRGGPKAFEEIAAGNYAPGWVDLSDEKWGLTVFVADFAPQYPKALDVVDNRVLVHLFAPYGKRTHWLEFNTCKTHDLFYYFHRGRVEGDRLSRLAVAWEEPLLFLPPVRWVADSRAWDMDLGVPPEPRSYRRSPRHRFDGRCAGWNRFGSFWTRGGINAGGYHPNMDTVLGRFLQTGDYEIFRRWSKSGRMMVELVPWSPEGFRFTPGRTPHTRRVYSRTPFIPDNVDPATGRRRPAFTPEEYEFYRYWVANLRHSPYYKKEEAFVAFEGYRSNEFSRPDSGHFGIFPAVETYHLTGDPTIREGLERIAEVLKFQIGHGGGACPGAASGARYQGWYQTGLAQIYNSTNDATILPYLEMAARWTLDHIRRNPRGFYGHRPGGRYGEKLFFVSGLVGGLYQNWLLTRNEDARDAIIALCDWVVYFVGYKPRSQGGDGLPYMWYADRPHEWKGQWHPRRLIPFAYGYLLTGRRDLYEIGADLYAGKPDPCFGAYQAWLYVAQHPRKDTIPPAAVRDLTVEPLGGGRVRVSFTAPGDDGSEGTAAEYQVKWSTLPLVEAIRWPEQKDTHRAFWWAENVADEPKPLPAGSRVSFEIAGLEPGKLYFAVKSFDEAMNISALSNVVEAEVK